MLSEAERLTMAAFFWVAWSMWPTAALTSDRPAACSAAEAAIWPITPSMAPTWPAIFCKA